MIYCLKYSEVENQSESQAQKSNSRQFQPNIRGRGRGRQQNFIQTKSIFEAGPGESAKKCK